MRLLFVLGLLVLPLAACKTTAEHEGTKVTIEDGDHHHGSHPGHCPTGHAKKGWC